VLTSVRRPAEGDVGPRSFRAGELPDWLRRPTPTGVWNAALTLAAVIVTAVLGWQQRWISDDGLIVLRTVRQLLAGNGPVFNIGERVEANTSSAWTAVLAIVGVLPGVDLESAAIVVGLCCAAAGFGLGIDAARRLHLPGGGAVLLPVGAVVLLALPPMRDFLTSGLETGLTTLWLAGSWWLLVRVARGERDGAPPWLAAVALGAGPLVRPDLGLFTVLGLFALVALLRLPRLLGLAGAAAALPVSYEIFRAGYYGLLVPNTALAKEASGRRWTQGVYYLQDTVATYWLWIPLAVSLLALGVLVRRRVDGWADRWATVLVATVPILAGLLMAAFVARVGGDFMHGRMLLPAITALLLPVFALPLTRWTLLPLLGVAAWTWICVADLRVDYGSQISATGIVDERAFWSQYLDVDRPVRAAEFIAANGTVRTSVPAVQRAHPPAVMLMQGGLAYSYWRWFPARAGVDHITIYYLNLGMMAAAHPLNVRVVDSVGLSNPLGAHATAVFGGRIGHDKDLPPAWYVADEVRRGAQTSVPFPSDVAYARAALRCPKIADVLDSVRAPLTPRRFWDNLVGSPARTELRFSRIPQRAADCDS
jgi:arabinofuranosyltransferase